ncbi:MAG: hypothetical protein GKR91_05010 [Pseudomonadales bacterium]|nr:hypothetical protein [Pseudomonadales bacterium]
MNTSTKILIVLATIVGFALVLANTRVGVFLVFDVVGGSTDNLVTDTSTGPLSTSRSILADSRFSLPPELEQPSGIVVDESTVYISTDQAELFVLDRQFILKEPKSDLIGGILLLKQGSLEAITLVDEQVVGIGEIGVIGVWARAANHWERLEDLPLPESLSNSEFTGVCMNGMGRWATTDGAQELFNLDDGSEHSISYGSFAKPDGDLTQLMISGVDCNEDNFYLITENFTSIIVLDLDFRVMEVIGIDAGEASDIAIHNLSAYVTVDHNLFDDRPPVYRYELSQ